jgi:hypothetical protein
MLPVGQEARLALARDSRQGHGGLSWVERSEAGCGFIKEQAVEPIIWFAMTTEKGSGQCSAHQGARQGTHALRPLRLTITFDRQWRE